MLRTENAYYYGRETFVLSGEGRDSIHKTFLRGQNFITSLKIENSHMEDSHKNVLYKVIHRSVV